jgi:hypothetical protein
MDRFIQSRLIVFLITFLFSANSYATDYPPPACVVYEEMTLTICPPDSIPGPPVQLLGYNIYNNDEFLGNIPLSPPFDTVSYDLETGQLAAGANNFCVKAVYNLWISEPACIIAFVGSMPFLEDWSSGSFETNGWNVSGDHWEVSSIDGHFAPSLIFNGQPAVNEYEQVIESCIFTISDTIPYLSNYLSFDIKVVPNGPLTGTERISAEVWDSDGQSWVPVCHVINQEQYYLYFEKNIVRLPVNGNYLKVRFIASGANSGNILYWSVDNISVERYCPPPTDLTYEYNYMNNTISLSWVAPYGVLMPDWVHWDDGTNYNSIGTDDTAEFDVAARWLPVQLKDLTGVSITQVAFFPDEANADYTIKIWKGAGASELIYSDPVDEPVIGQWNYVTVDPPLLLDNSSELWVGYNVNALTGYPAGTDDGPAFDGYGNMLYYGNTWQTLLQINPDLDYNWNIKFFYSGEAINDTYFRYINIYHMTDGLNYEWIDSTLDKDSYVDSNLSWVDVNCYMVNTVYSYDNDTCISPYSNEFCLILLNDYKPEMLEDFLVIFPNPASDVLHVTSQKPMDEILVYNGIGELVSHSGYGGSETTISITNLPNGLYFIRIREGQSMIIRKFVVLR